LLLVSIVPLTAMMQTLEPGPEHHEDLYSPEALPAVLTRLVREYDKPLVVSVDSGKLYDAYARALGQAGVPVFRTADSAARFLGKLTAMLQD
jgi:acyl-CoA synthetase (NDP forming)